MKYTFSLILLCFSFFFLPFSRSFAGCAPSSGSWNAIDGHLGYAINRFHIDGYSGSFLNDTNIVATIASTTAGYNSGYADHSAMTPVILQQGGVYNTAAYWNTATYKQELQVWIDFNDNGVFEVSEEVSPVSGYHPTATPNPSVFSITVPAGAATGLHLMRMRGVWEQTGGSATHPAHLDPCAVRYLTTDPTYYTGDAVDYKVNIISSAACSGMPIAGTVVSSPFSCSGNNFTVSLSGSSTGSGFTYQWQSSPDSSSWTNISGGTTMTYSLMQTDTTFYHCLVTCTVSGLSAWSAGVKVDTAASPVSGTITGPPNICMGAPAVTYTITGNSLPGIWSTPSSALWAGVASIDAGGHATGVLEGGATISYSVTNICGTAISIYPINILAAPSAGIFTPNQICLGSTLALNAGPAGGTWTISNDNVLVTPPDSLVTGMHPGVDTITYAVNEACGLATATLYLYVYDTTAGTVVSPDTICEGETVFLVPTVYGGSWTATGMFGHAYVDGSSGYLTGHSGGPDTVMHTISNYCGTFYDLIPIYVHPATSVGAILGDSTICHGSSATLSDTATGGTWSGSNTNATIGSGGLLTGLATGSAIVTYTITDFCGTARATVHAIIETAITGSVITGPTSLCAGNEITLSDLVLGGVWLASNTNAYVSALGTVTGFNAGTVTISYIAQNSCGADTVTHVMTINPLPVAGVITGEDTVCVGASITLSNVATGGVWSGGSGRATVADGVVTGTTPGIAVIFYTATNGCGSASANYHVRVLSAADCTTGFPNLAADGILKIYPNPSDGYINLELPASQANYEISVLDIMGATVEGKTISATGKQVVSFDLGSVPAGSYLVRVVFGREVYYRKLLIVK